MLPDRGQEALIRRAYRAFAARDLEALRAISDPSLEVRTLTGVLADRHTPYRGHDGLSEYLADVSEVWDELELLPGEFHQLDDARTLVFGRVRAKRGATLIDAPNAWLWSVSGERVLSVEVFGDPESAHRLLGDQP